MIALMSKCIRLLRLIAILSLPYSAQLAAAEISVAATIRPLQLIAQAIMQDHGSVSALIDSKDSPHHYALTPGDRLIIEDADILLWIGPEFEVVLSDVYRGNNGVKSILTVADIPDLTVHSLNDSQDDPHFWLSTDNALLIARELVLCLSEIEPSKEQSFQLAFDNFELNLSKTDLLIEESLSLFRDKPFLVFHDAFQYFEKQFGLTGGEFLLQDPEMEPSMNELLTIRRRVEDLSVSCLLLEPGANDALVSAIFGDQKPSREFVDLLGFEVADGPQAYVNLVTSVANSFSACLSEG